MSEEVARLKEDCKGCEFINPWTGSHECSECIVGRTIKKLRYEEKLKSQEKEYGKLFHEVYRTFEFHPRQLSNIVQITRRYYRFGGDRETPLSALKRVKEALEAKEYLS